jgi:ABC-type transporter Mla MlaB component
MGPSPPRQLTLAIGGPLERADLPGLFERTCALLEGIGPEVLCCDAAAVAADAVAVDALARLALAARRHGADARLIGASPELRALVAFMGLTHVLRGVKDLSAVEPRREAEQREDRVGAEEERELDDPTAGHLEHL